MKLSMMISIFLLVFLFIGPSQAQFHFSGFLQSSLYSWQDLEENQLWDYYQGLQLTLTHQKFSNIRFNSYMRVARSGEPADWEERVYNFYLDWKTGNNNLKLRAGRQFVFSGVMNGTVDGLLATISPNNKLRIKILGGMEATQARNFKVREWEGGNVLGGQVAYKFGRLANFDVSYFQKARFDETVWQLAGAALNGYFLRNLFYQANLDYNLKTEDFQGMRLRLTYFLNKWSFSTEFNSQQPRIYEDSYFRIFNVHAFKQSRNALTYRLGQYQLGVQYLYTNYENDNHNHEFNVSVASTWGMVGVLAQDGFAGERAGVYGQIRYDLFPQLTVNLYSSYQNFQRHSIDVTATDITEEATAFSGGLDYRPFPSLILRGEIQETMNSFFENDLRGLVQVQYLFNF